MSDHATNVGKTFPWHELYVPNSAAAKDFYTSALGWGTQDMEMSENFTYSMFTNNGIPIGGVMQTKGTPGMEDVRPQWAIYVAVDDVDARLEKCKSLGATCIVEPMTVPKVGRMALIEDPQGAHFWIYKSDEA